MLVINGGDDARSSKGNKNRQLGCVPNEIGGKESWTTGLSVETVLMEPVPNVREIGLLILITI